MSYDAYEDSLEDGQPIFLYMFTLNDKVWRYTSAALDITAGGALWTAVPISDDGVSQTGQSQTDALTITASSSIEPAVIYINYPPSRPIGVTIFAKHAEDDEIKAFYLGEVSQVNSPVPGTAHITCETLSATMDRAGLRLGWQRTCPYALYDEVTCKVDKTLHDTPGVVSVIDNNLITVPALVGVPVDKFAGGYLEWTDPVRGVERRTIESNDASGNLRMFGTADGISVGLAVIAYPGCKRTTLACDSFNNILNFGGVPGMQGYSPFDGNPVFY